MVYEYYDATDPNSFKRIPEDPATLDLAGCKYLGEIHQALKEQLGLPDYYGENWDALWDCLQYFRDYPITVEVYGTTSLPKSLAEETIKMLAVFDEVNRNSMYVQFVLKS